MDQRTVYVETSIVSYLTARPSNDLRASAHQTSTVEWWDSHPGKFDLYISEFVLAEAALGDNAAAARRLAAVDQIPILDTTDEAQELQRMLMDGGAVPEKGAIDAFHISVATVHGMEYLLTWNCKHIANAIIRPKIETICANSGFEPPIICTPEELMEA